MTRQKAIKTIFSILGTELDKIKKKNININFQATNFRKDGFDIRWTYSTEHERVIIDNIKNIIRIDNKIWFDSGFHLDKNELEWNLDWSIEATSKSFKSTNL